VSATLRTIYYRAAATGGSFSTKLADETASPGEFIRDFKPRMMGSVQVEPLFGSNKSFVATRGNRYWTLGFTVERLHASPEVAAAFLDTHATALPDSIDLKIVQGATITYLSAAAFHGLDATEPTGCSSTISYQFTGPTYNETAP